MALTMNDLKTVDDFNANNYGVEIGMNEQFQYFVTVKVNDVDHIILHQEKFDSHGIYPS